MVMKDPPRVDEIVAKLKTVLTSLQQLAAQKTGAAGEMVSNYYTGSKRILDKFLGTPVDIKAKFSAQHGMFAQEKAEKAIQAQQVQAEKSATSKKESNGGPSGPSR